MLPFGEKVAVLWLKDNCSLTCEYTVALAMMFGVTISKDLTRGFRAGSELSAGILEPSFSRTERYEAIVFLSRMFSCRLSSWTLDATSYFFLTSASWLDNSLKKTSSNVEKQCHERSRIFEGTEGTFSSGEDFVSFFKTMNLNCQAQIKIQF